MDIAPTNVQCATGHYDMYIENVFDAIQSVGAVAEFSCYLFVNSIHVVYAEKNTVLYSPLKL